MDSDSVLRTVGDAAVDITYCSNIYPGETLTETLENIRRGATEVKARVRPDASMGLGLRLSARAAAELSSGDGALRRLRAELDGLGIHVSTLNGFPYGSFHGQRVKEAVYRPDWRSEDRLSYTLELIRILGVLIPDGMQGSISTVPVGFRPEVGGDPAGVERSVDGLLGCAEGMWRLRETGGADLALALEPEPACYLETTDEAIRFLQHELLSHRSLTRFSRMTGLGAASAEAALRHHVGICLDTCHAAVEFEDPRETVRAIERAGVRLAKVQATAGLHVEPVSALQREALHSFADPVYLHQVVARCVDGTGEARLERFLDLDEALASMREPGSRPECWRVHYHVPIFERDLAPFTNTQEFLREVVDEVVVRQLCEQFEVETYTWSVLPERHRRMTLSEMIAGELGWVAAAVEESRRRKA